MSILQRERNDKHGSYTYFYNCERARFVTFTVIQHQRLIAEVTYATYVRSVVLKAAHYVFHSAPQRPMT